MAMKPSKGAFRESDYSPEDIVEYYSSEELYERYTEEATRGLLEKEQTVVERYFEPHGTVLDVGCGTGRTTAALRNSGFDVVGVDITPRYVDTAAGFFPDLELGVADATSLPFTDDCFEHVLFSFNGIDHLAPEEVRLDVFHEVRRVLEPGGLFAFSTHNPLFLLVAHPPTPGTIRKRLEFWVMNARENRLFSRYMLDNQIQGGPLPIYFIRPGEQRRQLRSCGFELIDLVGGRFLLPTRLDPHPYYVACSQP